VSRAFPRGFLFGCATSAYQIEGGIENDWSDWERAGRCKEAGTRCGRATDHWNRWERDVELLAELGAQAYRFSVEWARVEPRPNEWDDAAIARYVAIADALRAKGIEPFVTLLHFTHPTWFHESCPWHRLDQDAPLRFGRFAERVTSALGERVRFYTVLNEPSVWLSAAYLKGKIPPGRTSLLELYSAAKGLVRGHIQAHAAIKRAHPSAQVGIAKHYMHFSPSRGTSLLDRLAARSVAHQFNHAMIQAMVKRGVLDFLGINFYSRVYVELFPSMSVFYEDRDGRGINDMGWEIHPRGLTEAILDMHRYRLPIYVTENGIDDRDDSRRAAYIHDHLAAALDAIDAGADVRGYLHWSLLDNFEWLEGYHPRFGLYGVDYATLERKLTGGGDYYRRLIGERRLPEERPASRIKRGSGRVVPG
jgi:beta-glucosidase